MVRARMTVLALAAFAVVPVASRPLRAAIWEIDPAHTAIQFSVRHMMVSNVHGTFAKFSGHVDGDQATPTAARIEATIDAASIDTANQKRDEHLRSPDFLDVAKFPTITFKSKKLENAGEAKWKVTGDLTLHGVTREVLLDVSDVAPPIKDPMGNMRAGAEARTTINRQDFGVSFHKTLDGGGVIVGDAIAITIDVEVTKKSDAAPGR
ncbi:MAG: YceI family protein [Deltaproteobacteria bacterium]|nr:YceI family protein [Deltaproteobacteria bacterium]